jgi:hypothetical protein
MNPFRHAGCLGWLIVSSATGQVTPAHPTNFKTRPIGDRAAIGGDLVPAPGKSTTRHITYFVLSESRQWTSSEGKPITGKLIAFEDQVVESTPEASETAPVPPRHPTVIAAGKVRLLVNNKPFEVALERLSPPDREFIEKTRATHAAGKIPPPGTPPGT